MFAGQLNRVLPKDIQADWTLSLAILYPTILQLPLLRLSLTRAHLYGLIVRHAACRTG